MFIGILKLQAIIATVELVVQEHFVETVVRVVGRVISHRLSSLLQMRRLMPINARMADGKFARALMVLRSKIKAIAFSLLTRATN